MTAHRFQEKYSGVQIYVWHASDEITARSKFASTVKNPENWIFLGTTTI
jgi:hypothetical protein